LIEDTIKISIQNKKIIEFDYDGHHRVAEPHVHGISNGQYEIQMYQIAGGINSGELPDWIRVKGSDIANPHITERHFPPRRPILFGKLSRPFDKTFDIAN